MATSIRVGFNVGANDFYAARRSGWVAIGASFGFGHSGCHRAGGGGCGDRISADRRGVSNF